jgi:hypothetical protein
MAYVQQGGHVPVTTRAQIAAWAYASARPAVIGSWTTVRLSFVADGPRATVVLHGEGGDTAWFVAAHHTSPHGSMQVCTKSTPLPHRFRGPRLTVDGPVLWLADMGGGPDSRAPGRSVLAYDRLGHRLGALGAAAAGADAQGAGLALGSVADLAWSADGRTLLVADGDGGPFDRVLRLRPRWGGLAGGLRVERLPDIGLGRGAAPGELNNTHGLQDISPGRVCY